MHKVMVPFSTSSRCAPAGRDYAPGFHACECVTTFFDDDSRIEPVSRDDLRALRGWVVTRLTGLVAALLPARRRSEAEAA